MERILNAIETIEANAVRMFGFEDDRTREIFNATGYIRIMFSPQEENEEEGAIVFNEDELTFSDLVEMFNEGVNVAEILDECEDETILRIIREEILREMCE